MWKRLVRWLQAVPIQDPIAQRQAVLVQVVLLGLGGVLLFAALLTLVALPLSSGELAAANLRSSINNAIAILFVLVPFLLLRRGAFRSAVMILMGELLLMAYGAFTTSGLERGWLGAIEIALPISLAALALGRRWLLAVYLVSVIEVGFVAMAQYPLTGMPENALSIIISFALIAGLLALFLDRFGMAFRESLAAVSMLNADLERRVEERTRELEIANRAKSNFLANMSHELRTPLNAIIGFTGTLLMRLPGPLTPDQEKQLRTIQTSARHLLELINDMLDLAKIEAGKRELWLESLVCQEVISEVMTSLRPMAEQKKLCFTAVCPPEPVYVQTDRRALTQILLNLTNNAIKFTEAGEVRVTLVPGAADGPGPQISVMDTGKGIAEEDQTRLFQAFSQVDDTPTRPQTGTGLGLHLSQQLAHLLGGQITVESSLGAGSTFTLALPKG